MSDLLNKQLQVREDQFKSNSPQEYQILLNSIDYLQQSGVAGGLRVGDPAPDFTLNDALGKEVHLLDETAKGPVILTFYRGGWCPFCNLQLKAYQEALPRFRELGAKLIAVSPQSPDNALSQQEKEQLTFAVISDTDGRVASQYDVLYEVTGALKSLYEKSKLNLVEFNAVDRWILPISATFVIDSKAMIRFAYVDPNFMHRLEPEVIMEILRTL